MSAYAKDHVADRPNMLIFMTDQEQAQIAVPGHPCRTPNLDRLAREGLSFSSVYPPMAHCCPARASFMTGLYPSQHGIYNNVSNAQAINRSLKPGTETFAEKLREAGYELYYSGKWHVSFVENPRDRGWTELAVKAGAGAAMGTSREQWKAKRETDTEQTGKPRRNGELVRPGWGNVLLYGTADKPLCETEDYRVVHKAIRQLDSLKGASTPWCMYIGTTGPHDPFILPEPYASMYKAEDVPLPLSYQDDLADKPAVYRRMRKIFDQLSEREVRESIAHYWGYCTMMDDLLGETLEALERNGFADNTMVLFLSDHGEHAGAHGLYAKGISHFDEGYRVPCVIRWPGRVQAPGRGCGEFVSLTDFAPTLLEAGRAAPLGACAGQSLLPFLRGEKPVNWRTCMFAQCNGVEVFYTSRMVMTKQWKFVYHPTDIDELYDLSEDRYELRNLAEMPEMESIKKEMYKLMWQEAFRVEDTIFNPYMTIATADYGPAIANPN